jgi:aminopeptidase-like protein
MNATLPRLSSVYPDAPACLPVAQEAYELMAELFPICRSITGEGLRQTLRCLSRVAPLELSEVPSGTRLFDWEVPLEWTPREAWVRDSTGRKVVDFTDHNLHLVGYSVPFRGRVSLEELKPHLYSLPEKPDWIPYRTSYYRKHWGFCLRDRDLRALAPGEYEVCVDTSLEPGSLTYAEALVPGVSEREVLIYSHVCHPSLANDNLTGMTLAALLCRELGKRQPRLSYRFVFGPGTIGSLAWLAANESRLERIEHGLVLALLGDPGELTYKASRRGNADIDRAARHVVSGMSAASRLMDFEPYGYDERQFCSPGFDLPVGRLTRSANGAYPEYHTSADDLDLVGVPQLAESFLAMIRVIDALEGNRTCVNLAPKGEPRLGQRGLYGALGGGQPGASEQALLWVLNQSDGTRDLLAIAERSGLEFDALDSAASALEAAGLLEAVGPKGVGERSKS